MTWSSILLINNVSKVKFLPTIVDVCDDEFKMLTIFCHIHSLYNTSSGIFQHELKNK